MATTAGTARCTTRYYFYFILFLGKGIILTRNDEIYQGDIKDNYRHGHGVLGKLIPGTKVYQLFYRGEWRNGRMHGLGLRYFTDGSFYLGGYKRGKRHGHGQQWFPDGSFFDGEFKDDLREGLGKLLNLMVIVGKEIGQLQFFMRI